jgi:hypothetical protein
MLLTISHAIAQQTSSSAKTTANVSRANGQQDFDFEIGTWKTRVSRRVRPLTGSNTWVDYEGTSVVRKIWNGKANLVELEVDGTAGHIEGLSLRLYNPESRQWSLNYANSSSGSLTAPVVGEFRHGRGEFFGQDSLDGKQIFVKFVIWCSSQTTCHFEQSFSSDGGRNWEVNWKATDTRIGSQTDQDD